MKAILRLLKQPSTWKGLTWMLTLLGVVLSTEQREAIGVAGVAIVAVIEMFTDEDKRAKTVNIQLPPIELQSQSDDGYINRDALRSGLHVNMPPDHITGTVYDERRTDGFTDK